MHVSKRSHDLNLLEVTSAEDPNESWHAGGTLAASKQHQAARQDATKYLSLLESGGDEGCRPWTFNPLVGGSIPPRPTSNYLKNKHFFAFRRVGNGL